MANDAAKPVVRTWASSPSIWARPGWGASTSGAPSSRSTPSSRRVSPSAWRPIRERFWIAVLARSGSEWS